MVQFIKYKKSILFSIGFLFFMQIISAQDLARARELFLQKDYVRAKETIDSLIKKDSKNIDILLFSATLYSAISEDPEARNLTVDARQDAFNALQKAVQINAATAKKQLEPEGFALPLSLYKGYTNDGLVEFNAGAERNDKNSYASALATFKKAGTISHFIYNNSWGLTAIDTNNIFYCAKAAMKAGNDEDALLYSSQIADNGITGTLLNNNFEPVYQWLAYYYKEKNDKANLYRYIQLGAEKYPASNYFTLIKMDWLRLQKDYPALLNVYTNTIFKTSANKASYTVAYCQDLYTYLYEINASLKLENRKRYEETLKNTLLDYIKTNPNNTTALLLAGKLYINKTTDEFKEMAIRSTTDSKVLNNYRTQANRYYKLSNQYLLQIVNKNSIISRSNYNEALELLIANFRNLNQQKEVRKYQALLSKSAALYYKILILIILLFNIILIIGILIFYSVAIPLPWCRHKNAYNHHYVLIAALPLLAAYLKIVQ
jgi:hypothetical protein